MYTFAELSDWCSNLWKNSNGNFPISGISHDTRTLKPGDVYIAIKGATLDGHDFVSQAVEKGAAGLIVEREFPAFAPPFDKGVGGHNMATAGKPAINVPQMIVPDTMTALWQLAAGVRRCWTGTVVGITGSVGKTTVKELVASVLAQKGKVCKTPGNWNNDIGLPLSMLAADRNADFFVFELGMNHPGEIGRLAALLQPDWAVMTDIGKAHIEFFQGVEGIAEEKASLLLHADNALLDETSEWFGLFKSKCKGHIVPFGSEPFAFTVPQPGDHMIRNARRAAALGLELGLSPSMIQAGLTTFRPAPMRWETTLHNDIALINDAYNANPLSMRAALITFSKQPCKGRRFAVLGGMRELGMLSEEEHRDLGRFVDQLDLDRVITVGDAGAHIVCKGVLGVEKAEAAELLRTELRPGDQVLFKASRGERLETILDELTSI